MADTFASQSAGVKDHHRNSYNTVYLDGHAEAVPIAYRISDGGGKKFNDIEKPDTGSRWYSGLNIGQYRTEHWAQDVTWKKHFDIGGSPYRYAKKGDEPPAGSW